MGSDEEEKGGPIIGKVLKAPPKKLHIEKEVVTEPELRKLVRSGTLDWEDMNISWGVHRMDEASGAHPISMKITFWMEGEKYECEGMFAIDSIAFSRIPEEEWCKVHVIQMAKNLLISSREQVLTNKELS